MMTLSFKSDLTNAARTKEAQARATTVMLALIEEGYEVLARTDEFNNIFLDVAYNPYFHNYGDDRFMLVSEEEEENLNFDRATKKDATASTDEA